MSINLENCGWVTYSTMGNKVRVVDAVVLHNIIYVVTFQTNIGVISLNSSKIKFLTLKNTPNEIPSTFRLVNCNEQLVVLDFRCNKIRDVYRIRDVYQIDFSTMSYVKLETLGDIALFHVSERNSYALSNPNKWGYESNSVYALNDIKSAKCSVYSGDDKKLKKCIMLPAHGAYSYMFDWCFRHLQYEVDYSLVE